MRLLSITAIEAYFAKKIRCEHYIVQQLIPSLITKYILWKSIHYNGSESAWITIITALCIYN